MNRLVIPIAIAVLAVLLGAGCGSEHAVSLGKPKRAATTTEEVTGAVPTLLSLEVWFAKGSELVPVRRVHRPTARVATAAVDALLAGPTPSERSAGVTTAIPAGTRLLGISIHGGVATVDLTSDYQADGGSSSMRTRLAQVVYTLTQFPTVQGVRFRLDGTPVNVFSSAGIVLDHPVRRSDYANLLPAITVDTPSRGSRVTSPVRVSGTANVFEANVTVRVVDEKGRLAGRTFTTASCGTGCRGTYSATVPFTVDTEQPGTVVVSDDDAAGKGRPPHVVRVPVVLAPGP